MADVKKKPTTAEERNCGVCGLTCEIPHKCHAVELRPGRITWFRDAHQEDCWEQVKRHVEAPLKAELEKARELLKDASIHDCLKNKPCDIADRMATFLEGSK